MSAAHTLSSTGRCQEAQRGIMEALALEEIPERLVAHAEHCAACGGVLERARTLALATHAARRAHERAPDLSPAAWARIRQAVDEARPERRFARWGFLVLGLGAVAAVVLLAWPRGETGANGASGAGAVAGRGLETDWGGGVGAPKVPHVDPSALRAAEGGQPMAIQAGDHLKAGTRERLIDAFGRHHLTIAAGSDVAVNHWDADAMELSVESGAATFEVKRASPAETFVVWSGDVAVHVKGTIFTVERLAAGGTRVSVERGRVAVGRRGVAEEVMVSAGERVVFPATTTAAVEPGGTGEAATHEAHETRDAHDTKAVAKAAPTPTPKPEKVIEIDLGHERSAAVDAAEAIDLEHLMPAINSAMRAGHCVQALNALGEISKALGPETPRNVTWLTAWCKRKLGDVAGSRALFQRYGANGPWAVPAGDELPPLP